MDFSSPCAFAGMASRLVPAPLAVPVLIVSTRGARLIAALRSRSMTRPQWSQQKKRSTRHSLAVTVCGREQVLNDGHQRRPLPGGLVVELTAKFTRGHIQHRAVQP